jgi:hypothetical protein
VEDLPLILVLVWNLSVTAPKLAVIRDYYQLEHMVLERSSHLIERIHVLIERWDGVDIRLPSQGSGEIQIGGVVANRCGEPEGAFGI